MISSKFIICIIGLAAAAVVGIVGYYYLIYIPEKNETHERQLVVNRQLQDREQQLEDQEQIVLDTTAFGGCLNQRSDELWDDAGGISEKCIATENCVNNLNILYKQKAEDYCIQKYPRADLSQFPILTESLK